MKPFFGDEAISDSMRTLCGFRRKSLALAKTYSLRRYRITRIYPGLKTA
jgi:hypothetical protein